MDLKGKIRNINDFPKQGIVFRDITTLLKDGEALCESVDKIMSSLEGVEFDYVVGPESRGFIFGMPVAYGLKKGFVMIRKAGKLPAKTISKKYGLEYGESQIEIHEDAVKKGDKVVVIDDLLATGGTAMAIAELLEEMGAEVKKFVFLVELTELDGRKALAKYDVDSVVQY
ncbi:MAG: adenine phosphoribosyltransferase [Firmicutes bacterium]|nr:adenine phosphoribosyltransferase [Bacillota bacterium]